MGGCGSTTRHCRWSASSGSGRWSASRAGSACSFRVAGPLVGVSIRRYLGVDAAAARAALARVDAVFDDIAERLSDPTGVAFSLAIASPQPT